MQMNEPTVNQRGVEVKAGTRKPAMEQRQASTATTGSGTDPSLAKQIIPERQGRTVERGPGTVKRGLGTVQEESGLSKEDLGLSKEDSGLSKEDSGPSICPEILGRIIQIPNLLTTRSAWRGRSRAQNLLLPGHERRTIPSPKSPSTWTRKEDDLEG